MQYELKDSITRKNVERIMLISPPRAYYHDGTAKRTSLPLGIACIAAVLFEKGYEISILDCVIEGFKQEAETGDGRTRYGLSYEEISERIAAYNPDVVGITSLFSSQYDSSEKVMEIAKNVRRDIVTITGGFHPTELKHEAIINNNLDFILLGESDFSILSLLNALRSGDISKADGVVFRKGGMVREIPKSGYIKDLDSLPFPARHLFPMEKYSQEGTAHGDSIKASPYTPVMTSRGCVISCSFCTTRNFWGKHYRTRSPQNVIDEIDYLVNDYGIREIHFEDDNLTANKSRAKQIFKMMIDKGLNVPWCTPSGIAMYTLDDEMIELMKESGCYRISLAIESGCQEILHKVVGKPLDLNRVRKQVKKMKEVGLDIHAWFTIGYPDETKEQIYQSIRYAKELEVGYCSFNIVMPLPGSRVYEIARERKLLREPVEWAKMEMGKGIITTEHFTPEDIAAIRKDAWLYVNDRGKPSDKFMANLL